jgi:two-component system, cell cycle sensor histidine kinase and response regulator CckA
MPIKFNVLAMSSLFPRKTVADLAGVTEDIFAAAFLRSPLLSSINSFEDGRFLLVNDTFVQKTGYCREDILAKSLTEIGGLSVDDLNAVKVVLLRAGRVDNLLFTLRKADGSTIACRYLFEVVECGGEKQLLAFAQDVTRELASTIDLQRQTDYLEAIFNSVPSFLVLIDELGRVEKMNKHGAKISALNQQDAIGRLGGEVLACINSFAGEGCGKNRDCSDCPVRTRVESTFATGQSFTDEPGEMVLFADGQWVPHNFLVSTVLLKIDGKSRVMLSIHDITAHLRVEQEKNLLQKQLYQAQKLESIGRLAGGIAHDLNNLLVPILGYAEIMFEDFGDNDPRGEVAQHISRAGRRAADLLRQLLAFSRKQHLEYSVINLNQLLKGFENLLRRTLREDITLIFSCTEDLPNIHGDKGQLEQIIMNLAVNAQDAMPDGGTLTFTTAFLADSPARVFSKDRNAEHPGSVTLEVGDTGEGMEPQIIEQIFEPFFTTKSVDKGTGLGLSTVHGIIQQHGGTIDVISTPGVGTSFRLGFPVVTEKVLVKEDADREPSSGGSECILIVEDEDHLRELLCSALGRQGYRVLSSSAGDAALEILELAPEKVDLLLTDVVMPGINGKELYHRAVGKRPDLKVLYMSGHNDEIISRRGILEEGIWFIEKPFSVKTLNQKIREVLS